jgi:tetratricopeptide (TPR) repeat protein
VGLAGVAPAPAVGDEPPASADATATDLNNRGVLAAQGGRFEEGVSLLRQAIERAPKDLTVRRNLSGILTDWAPQLERQGKIDDALRVLEQASRLDPTNGIAFARLGDLLYLRRGEMAQAIEAWRQAHRHVAAAARQAIANRITQAQRDALIERGFVGHQTAHFDIRVEHARRAEVSTLERLLETCYEQLSRALGQGPARLAVIVYAERDLRRVYNQRDWAIGFYDGRIRFRLDDIAEPYLADVLAHELAHAFLHHLYGDGLPVWVHEGYAQLQEREHPRNPEETRIEEGVKARTLWVPLKWLDRRFVQPSGTDDLARAYVQARLVVGELVARHGGEPFRAFLAQLSRGTAVEVAYDHAFAPSRWSRADQGLLD